MTTRVTVRRVRLQDAGRMRALRLEMLADTPLAFLETLAEAAALPHREFADRLAGSSFGHYRGQFIAEADGRFVAHAGGIMSADDPKVTIIFAVYITPAYRGAGMLRQLVDAVAAWSRSAGRPELMLEVVVGNDRARKAYERLGFVDTGVRVPHPVIPVLREFQMHRPA